MEQIPYKPLVANRDRPSARVLNATVRNLNAVVASLLTHGLIDSAGFHTRLPPTLPLFRIYEVQSAATGDGLYICYRQKLDATNWADETGLDKLLNYEDTPTEVTVLNWMENDPVEGTYAAALAKGDRLLVFDWGDDEGRTHVVGIPLTAPVRTVRLKENAPAASIDSTSITCNLIDNEGNEITSGLGSAIEVFGRCGVSVDWDEAIPIIINDKYMQAEWIAGKWWFVDSFQAFDTDHFQITSGKLQDKLDTCPLG